MQVVLLGAGASRAYAEYPTELRMPLARDFFATFESLEIAADPWVLQEGLINYLERYKGVDPLLYLRSNIDIEDLHSEIGERVTQLLRDGPNIERVLVQRAYHELIFLFAATLNVVQNGPASRPHGSIARALTARDVVVTFNWDTLMDRALTETGSWAVDRGYGVTPRMVFRDGWQTPTSSIGGDAGPALLKLHGSTNWLVGHPVVEDGKIVLTQESPPESLHVFEYATKPYATFAGRYMSGYGPFSYGYYPPNLPDRGRAAKPGHAILRMRYKLPWRPDGPGDSSGLVSIPLIVPPVKEKDYSLFGSLFTGLWRQAEDALAEAEHVLIIGYSFPRTDHRSVTLWRGALARRKDFPRVTIVDPSPQRPSDVLVRELGFPGDRIYVEQRPFSEETDVTDFLSR